MMPFKDPERKREHNRLYRQLNRERLRPQEREKARRQRERRAAYKKEWYAIPEVKERQLRLVREWIAQNEGKHRAYAAVCQKRRKARQKNAVGHFTRQQWLWRLEYFGHRCAYCRTALSERTAQIDHIIPLSVGGSNWPSNLAPACRRCNCSKGARRITPAGRNA